MASVACGLTAEDGDLLNPVLVSIMELPLVINCLMLVFASVIVMLLIGADPEAELVRHFLIETTSKGVRLKGCNNEPTFGELNHHSSQC